MVDPRNDPVMYDAHMRDTHEPSPHTPPDIYEDPAHDYWAFGILILGCFASAILMLTILYFIASLLT